MRKLAAPLVITSALLHGCASTPAPDTPAEKMASYQFEQPVYGLLQQTSDGGYAFTHFSASGEDMSDQGPWVNLLTMQPAWSTENTITCMGGIAGDCYKQAEVGHERVFYEKNYQPGKHAILTIFTAGIGLASIPYEIAFDEEAYNSALAQAKDKLGDYHPSLQEFSELRTDYENRGQSVMRVYNQRPTPTITFDAKDVSGLAEYVDFDRYVSQIEGNVTRTDLPDNWKAWPEDMLAPGPINSLEELNSEYKFAIDRSIERLEQQVSTFDVSCDTPSSVHFPLNVTIDCPTTLPVDGESETVVKVTLDSVNLGSIIKGPSLLVMDLQNEVALTFANNALVLHNKGSQYIDLKTISISLDGRNVTLSPNKTLSPRTRFTVLTDVRHKLGKTGLFSDMTREKAKNTTISFSAGMSYDAKGGSQQKFKEESYSVLTLLKTSTKSS